MQDILVKFMVGRTVTKVDILKACKHVPDFYGNKGHSLTYQPSTNSMFVWLDYGYAKIESTFKIKYIDSQD